MKTYHFWYCSKKGLWAQVEVNAESEDDAWKLFHSLISDVIYVDLLK